MQGDKHPFAKDDVHVYTVERLSQPAATVNSTPLALCDWALVLI